MHTLKEAREILRVSNKTIQRWDKKGKIRCVRTPGNRRLIPESEILRIIGNISHFKPEKTETILKKPRINPEEPSDLSDKMDINPEKLHKIPEKSEINLKKPFKVLIKEEKLKKTKKDKLVKVVRSKDIFRHDLLDDLEPPSLMLRSAFGDLLSAATLMKKFTYQDLAARARCPESVVKLFCDKMSSLGYLSDKDEAFEIQIEVLR